MSYLPYRIFPSTTDPKIILDYLNTIDEDIFIQTVDQQHLLVQTLSSNDKKEQHASIFNYFPLGQEKELEEWITQIEYKNIDFYELSEGYLLQAKKEEEDEVNTEYRLFAKNVDPEQLLNLVQSQINHNIYIEEIHEHFIVHLFNFEPDQEKHSWNYFSFEQIPQLETWLNEMKQNEVECYKMENGYLVQVFSQELTEWEDKFVIFIGVFMALSPLWFIGMLVFAFLYFS